MRFDLDVYDTQAIPLLTRLIQITGEGPWARKFKILQQQGTENRFLRDWQVERNGIELKFGQLRARQEAEGRFRIQPEDHLHYDLYGFAAGIVRIHDQLSPRGQRRLKGMLLDGLKPDNNLLSLQHEVITAVHLVQRGYDVEMNDLERGSGVDFIATREGLQLEVECKMFTGDLGRKLHRRKVLMLHKHLFDTVLRAYQSAQRGLFIRITVPDRLHCGNSQLHGIEQTLSMGLQAGKALTKSAECETEITDFAIAESPFNVAGPNDISRKALEDFSRASFGRVNKEMMIVFSPGKRAVIALVESAQPDEVLKGVARQLRDTAKHQFTGTRPGVIAAQFQELSADAMENLAREDSSSRTNANGLQIVTSDFLNSPKRAHIHTVVYRSHGRITRVGHTITGTGPAYFIRNPGNALYADPRARAFGEGSDEAAAKPEALTSA